MTKRAHTHFEWSEETPDGVCPCGVKTIMVIASSLWNIDDEELVDEDTKYDGITIDAEVTGHYCRACDRLVSLSFNQGTP